MELKYHVMLFAIASYHVMLLVLDLVCCLKNFNVSNAKFIKNGENVENLSLTISLVFKVHHQSPLNVNNNVPIIVNQFSFVRFVYYEKTKPPFIKNIKLFNNMLWMRSLKLYIVMDARRFVASSCYYILMVSNGHKLIKRYTIYQFKISRRSIAFKVLYFIYIFRD